MKRLSIIIPLYNEEPYIKECLLSLTRQGFNKNDYEIIVVNDGSIDKSKDYVLELIKEYDYITLINQEHKGTSNARNTGIKASNSKYITFIDADDYVSDNLYLPILDILDSHDYAAMYFGATRDKDKLETFNNTYYEVKDDNAVKMSVCRMVYKADIIKDKNLLFKDDISFCEDFLFNYMFKMINDKGVVGNAQCCYYYRLNQSSKTSGVKSKEIDIGKEYISSLLKICSYIKETAIKDNKLDNKAYKKAISQAIMIYLWGNMIFKFNIRNCVKELNKHNVQLKDITYKVNEGDKFKHKIKSHIEYNFRYKWFYYLTCFIYKLIIH